MTQFLRFADEFPGETTLILERQLTTHAYECAKGHRINLADAERIFVSLDRGDFHLRLHICFDCIAAKLAEFELHKV